MVPAEEMTAELAALGATCGVVTTYVDWLGTHRDVPATTVRRVLAAMGVAADTDADVRRSLVALAQEPWRRAVPGTIVVRRGGAAAAAVRAPLGARPHVELTSEQGERLAISLADDPHETQSLDGRRYGAYALRLPDDVPLGYHRLVVFEAGAGGGDPQHATLVVAPPACPSWEGERPLWGWMFQLYAIRSGHCWGIGDLGVLRDLADWSGRELGAGLLLCNPLHAVAPVLPQEPSPYYPASRRFTNPLYLSVEDIPERKRLAPAAARTVTALADRLRRSNTGERIDRDLVFTAKQEALELVYAVPRDPVREAAFGAYRRREGQGLEDFATFCVLAERHGAPWTTWPEPLRHPSSPSVAAVRRDLPDRIAYHAWLQWLCEQQLAAAQDTARRAGMPVGIVHDLAVGVDPGGADGWALQNELATAMTVGAPPDAFNQRGQDWRLPPLLPNRLLDTAYAPFGTMVRSLLQHAGGVRIDHAMGLFRLWWIPDGCFPSDGAYVRYPARDLLGVLALEAERASAIVVAEDLGTVEGGVRETLQDWRIFGSAVLYFERMERGPDGSEAPLPAAAYRRHVLASITTHDLPTAAGFWTGEALRVQQQLGLLPADTTTEAEEARAARDRAALQALLQREGLVGPDPTLDDLVSAMHTFIAHTPSLLVTVSLGDALGDVRQPNMPGTTDEYPNWRLPLVEPGEGVAAPVLLEDLLDHPRLRRIAAILRAGRAAVTDAAPAAPDPGVPRGPERPHPLDTSGGA